MPQQHPTVAIPFTEQFMLHSTITERDYQIYIALPINYHTSNKTYPVLYAPDANIVFEIMAGCTRALSLWFEVPEIILVGVGYAVETEKEVGLLRNQDLTPTATEQIRQVMIAQYGADGAHVEVGGADKYLEFIRGELQPYINQNYRIDSNDWAYFGDSLGGLFGCYVLFHAPDTFTRYIIGSPSLWYDNAVTFDYEAQYAAQHNDLAARVFLGVGALEEPPGNQELAEYGMVTNMKKLTTLLTQRNYPSFKLSTHIFENETHVSVIPSNFSWGLRTVYDAPNRLTEFASRFVEAE